MTGQDCLRMLREMRDVVFATVDGQGRPRARIIDVMMVEEGKLYFCTARGKDFYQELTQNGYVAIAGLNREWQTVRLTGKAVRLADTKRWIDRIFEENPSMNDVYPGESRYILDPFCISAGELEFFDLGKTPVQRESFAFGGNSPLEKGFFITDGCIGCGTCAENCPQKCIEEGAPYVIHQENCLHCGLCAENCPTESIVRRESRQTET